MKNKFLILLILVFSLGTLNCFACTTFNLQTSDINLFGRNYDWSVGDGFVIVNKRGLVKTAMKVKDDPASPAIWTAKYGSLTFNQYGREFPQGGINEAGLVVEMMAVSEGAFPALDSRPYVGKAQYRQYLLDNFKTVQEVVESDSSIRLSASGKGPLTHLLISDHTGASAVIEFIDGKRVVYTGESLPVRVLSNSPYSSSVTQWKANTVPEADQYKSIERFNLAANQICNFDPKSAKAPVEQAFELLKQVAQPDSTKWSIVYDIKDLKVHFFTAANPAPRSIDLKKIDFYCSSPVKVLDIDAGTGELGDAFQDYTLQTNRKLIADAFGKTDFLKNIPAQTIDAIAAYPDSAKCEQ